MVYTRPYWVVLVSSISTALPFIVPCVGAELLFISLVPLMWFSHKRNYSFSVKLGALWGFIFYSLFFFDIYLYTMHYGHSWLRYGALITLVFYNSFLVCCWFFLAKIFSRIRCVYPHLIAWSLATIAFYFFNDYYYFFPLGAWHGNTFIHVSVPLAGRALWIFLLQFLGKQGLLCFVVGVNGFLAYLIISKNYHFFIFSCLGIVFACIGFQCFYIQEPPEEWIKDFGCVCIAPSHDNSTIVAERIMQALNLFVEQYGAVNYIIMPESTFAFPLNGLKKYCSLWQCGPEKKIFLGSHRMQGSQLFNTLYCIEDGMIVDFYDKQHTMLFTEYIPSAWSIFYRAQSLFLHNKMPFDKGVMHTPFMLPPLGNVYPLICSDLFMGGNELPGNQHYLCCVNDSWFFHSYPSTLMLLYAKVIAVLKHSYIIYCAYKHTGIITPSGDIYKVPTLTL